MKKTMLMLLCLSLLLSMMSASAEAANLSFGSIITFGRYEQDNDLSNGPEPIEWIVLDSDEEGVLLISKYGLDAKAFNAEATNVTWESCTLRQWLNSIFLDSAFTSDEQAQLLLTHVTADRNPSYRVVDPGKDTQDKVWLPSIVEMEKYIASGFQAQCVPTDYAIAQSVITGNSDEIEGSTTTCLYWLRSTGKSQYDASAILFDGSVYATSISFDGLGVRPVIRLTLG